MVLARPPEWPCHQAPCPVLWGPGGGASEAEGIVVSRFAGVLVTGSPVTATGRIYPHLSLHAARLVLVPPRASIHGAGCRPRESVAADLVGSPSRP